MEEQNQLKPNTQPQPEQPEPEQPSKPRGRLSRFLVHVIATLIVLAAALCLVAAVAFRDSLNLDSAKRWFTYRSLLRGDNGRAESFVYDGDLTDTFAVLDGDLLTCSDRKSTRLNSSHS